MMVERRLRLFIALASGKALAVPLNLATTVLVGWLLGPSGLGKWALLAAAGTLLHAALINWTHPSTVRYGHEEWLRTRGLNRTLGARLPLLVLGVSTAVALVVFEPAQWLQRGFAAEESDWWMVALFALSVWLAAEAQATLQATDRILWQATIAPLLGVVSVVALLGLLWTGHRSLGAAVLAATMCPIAGWAGALIFGLARSSTRVPRLDLRDVGRTLRYAAPLLPMFALGYVSDWGDHLLLRYFSSVTQVGLFGVSYQFTLTIVAANGMLTTLLLPRLIAHEVAAPGSARTSVKAEFPTIHALWMIGTVWLVALVPVAARQVTDSEFDESSSSLLVLLVTAPSSVVTSLYTVLFNLQERMGRMLVYLLLMTLTNVAVSLALIPTYGAVGAAIGTAVSYALSQALYVRDQHRALAVPALKVWTLWAAGLALGVLQLTVGTGVAGRLAWALVATAVLIGIVRAMGCVDDGLVARLFAGRLSPVAAIISRTLVAKTS
jgi:O-antigen/teichoic acid export membrane protein